MHNRNNAISSSPVLPPVMRNLPNAGLRTVPQRLKNLDYRSREYLTEHEVDQLISAAGKVGRHGHRDATLIMLTYRHGLRVSELVSLRWDQVDLRQGLMHIN